MGNADRHLGRTVTPSRSGPPHSRVARRTPLPRTRRALRHLFIFIGAEPNADWARSCIDTAPNGFVTTGAPFSGAALACGRAALPLETSRPSVFAIGDVRFGSTKRVAAEVGEGAAAVAQIHVALAHHPTGDPANA